jgi:hypothetical protein
MANDDDLLKIFDTRKKSAPVFNWEENTDYTRRKIKPFDALFTKYTHIRVAQMNYEHLKRQEEIAEKRRPPPFQKFPVDPIILNKSVSI